MHNQDASLQDLQGFQGGGTEPSERASERADKPAEKELIISVGLCGSASPTPHLFIAVLFQGSAAVSILIKAIFLQTGAAGNCPLDSCQGNVIAQQQ